jgi:2-dehydropantoate 2-reductase
VLDRAAQLGIAVPRLERLVAQIAELEGGAAMSERRIADLAGALR